MNTKPIDIVVPWVNPDDENWKKDFNFWKEKETGNKEPCRYRDWKLLRFVFRSIEDNCPWCRYVFLILSSPSQIPDWLNVNNPKLKIVYHKDYIPSDFLPTFNSNVIELFYPNIKELSDNFILINDDMFFWNKKDESFFFENDTPVMKPAYVYYGSNKHQWEITCQNSLNLSNEVLGKKSVSLGFPGHIPVSYNKMLCSFVLYKIKNKMSKIFKHSKFRQNNNIMHFLYCDIHLFTKRFICNNEYRGQIVGLLGKDFTFNDKSPLMCFNEGELTTEKNMIDLLKILTKKFNKISSFEK